MYEEKKQPRVLVFTTPTCGYCTKAKSYLKRNGKSSGKLTSRGTRTGRGT